MKFSLTGTLGEVSECEEIKEIILTLLNQLTLANNLMVKKKKKEAIVKKNSSYIV